jgi:hypothetical protein
MRAISAATTTFRPLAAFFTCLLHKGDRLGELIRPQSSATATGLLETKKFFRPPASQKHFEKLLAFLATAV